MIFVYFGVNNLLKMLGFMNIASTLFTPKYTKLVFLKKFD